MTETTDKTLTPSFVAPTTNAAWDAFIAPFAAAIGKDAATVGEALKPLVGELGAEAVDLLNSEEYTPFEDLRKAFEGVPLARLKKAVADHLRKAKVVPETVVVQAGRATGYSALPPVPDNGAWLTALKSGGELKVDQTSIYAAIRAGIASRVGFFDLPSMLAERMERYAEELEEPASAEYYKLRKLLTRRSYADVLTALDIEGSFVTQSRKNQLLAKLDEQMWPALFSFQNQLKGWVETWQQGSNNPAMTMGMIAMASGGGQLALPPGMMEPPATDGLHDAAESVIQKINRIFAGTGIPVARALAYDANQIMELLENSSLPAQIGAANREQMLKMLNVAVTNDYPRMERNLIGYVLAIMEFDKVTGGNDEIAYLTDLVRLGMQIPWDKLQAPARKAGVRSRIEREESDEWSGHR